MLFTNFLGELLKLSVPMDAAGIKRYKTFKMQYVKKKFLLTYIIYTGLYSVKIINYICETTIKKKY